MRPPRLAAVTRLTTWTLGRPGAAPLEVAARLSSAVRSSVQDGGRAPGMSFDNQHR
jgi:hypothetical protein